MSPSPPGWSALLAASAAADTVVKLAGAGYLLYRTDWSSGGLPVPLPEEPTESVAWCSASDWSAPDGSGLLKLDASSIQTDPDRSYRMINRIIKQVRH